MNQSEQSVFDFETGSMAGFENWKRQQEAHLEAMRNEWNLPFGKRVRVRLVQLDADLVGKLQLKEMPVTIDKRISLHLQIEGVTFHPQDISRWILAD